MLKIREATFVSPSTFAVEKKKKIMAIAKVFSFFKFSFLESEYILFLLVT